MNKGNLDLYVGNFDQNETTTFAVFFNLEKTGLHRPLSRWPLHLTIVAPFTANSGQLDYVNEMTAWYASKSKLLGMKRETEATLFGPLNDKPVHKLHASETNKERAAVDEARLRQLHTGLFDACATISSDINDTYSLERYAPHVSVVPGLVTPETIVIHSLSLMMKNLDGTKYLVSTHSFPVPPLMYSD